MAAGNPNILLLILDSTRARNIGIHGYHRKTTPFLEQFAASATTYMQARAPAGRSLPSHASIFSGYLPQEHRINGLDSKLIRDASIFGHLTDDGYETGLFTDNPYLTDLNTGLSAGFDTIVNNRDLFDEGESPSVFVEEKSLNHIEFISQALRSDAPAKSMLNGLSWMLKWRFPRLSSDRAVFSRGFTYANRFEEWRNDIDGPWAACINLMDTHVPFRPDGEYNLWETSDSKKAYKRADMDDVAESEQWKRALLENRYDGTIRQADAVVEQIVTTLDVVGELSDTYVVVTADHGEGFGEQNPIHGAPSIGHGDAVDETLLHVPLIVKAPGQQEGNTVHDPVGLVDTPIAIEHVVEGVVDAPTYVTDRTVFAGGVEDNAPIDVAYERDKSHGVRKYVQGERGAWSVHLPTPRTAYCLREGIPESVEDAIDTLSPASVTQDTDAEVSESVEQQLRVLGYTE